MIRRHVDILIFLLDLHVYHLMDVSSPQLQSGNASKCKTKRIENRVRNGITCLRDLLPLAGGRSRRHAAHRLFLTSLTSKSDQTNMSSSFPVSPEPTKERSSAPNVHQYGRKLYEYSAEVREPHFLEYRHLQRINLTELQNELARQKVAFSKTKTVTPTELQALRITLHSYSMTAKASSRSSSYPRYIN